MDSTALALLLLFNLASIGVAVWGMRSVSRDSLATVNRKLDSVEELVALLKQPPAPIRVETVEPSKPKGPDPLDAMPQSIEVPLHGIPGFN